MAKAQDEDVEKVEAQPEVKKSGGMVKWIIIGVVALVVLGGAAGGAWWFFVASAPKKAAPVQAQPAIGTIYPLEAFIVNVPDNQGERYLKLVCQLEVQDPQTVKELDILKPKIRDNIIDLLSAKTYKDLMEVTGKQRLREEIVLRLNTILGASKITRVYITDFVIQ